jgi:hypothetical protein
LSFSDWNIVNSSNLSVDLDSAHQKESIGALFIFFTSLYGGMPNFWPQKTYILTTKAYKRAGLVSSYLYTSELCVSAMNWVLRHFWMCYKSNNLGSKFCCIWLSATVLWPGQKVCIQTFEHLPFWMIKGPKKEKFALILCTSS